jgi:hypothetical protein
MLSAADLILGEMEAESSWALDMNEKRKAKMQVWKICFIICETLRGSE